ncbi:fimbria/pilus periplasmic chaperone [Proteus mirabilis]
MKYSTLAMLIIKMVITTCLTISFFSYGAVTLDRTRIIFPGNENAVNITIINDNPEEAYLAQSWIEDINGNKLTKGAILATPPLQRVEPKRNSLVRLSKTPEIANLPKDRESIFYFNLREVPPKSKSANTLQIALQSRVKLFYRPEGILNEAETKWPHKITLTRISKGYIINNETPFYLTVIGIGDDKGSAENSDFKVIMVEPKSQKEIIAKFIKKPHLTYINDYGGKPTLVFNCQDDTCKVIDEK